MVFLKGYSEVKILEWLHHTLKTDHGFRNALKSIPFTKLQKPIIQTAKYEPSAVSLLERLPWMSRKTLIHSRLVAKKRQFSILDLSGVWAGKIPGNIHVDTFLDYGKALNSAAEYTLENRIGYETEADFQHNIQYLTTHLKHISGNEDGIPIVRYREWDDSYYLINIDGANHFAAVYRQCVEQKRDFKFPCRIEHQTLNIEECRWGLKGHGLLILPTSSARPLAKLLAEFGLRIEPFWFEFQPEKSLISIGLDETIHPSGRRLYQCLIDVLPNGSYFDLGEHLRKIVG